MKVNLCAIKKLLDEVDNEYSKRYAWGDDNGECIYLFHKIRYKIEEEISLAYKNNKTLSTDTILEIVENFGHNWPNKPTECNDTDGKIHINSIYDKLALAFSSNISENTHTKNKNIYIWIIYLSTILICAYVLLR